VLNTPASGVVRRGAELGVESVHEGIIIPYVDADGGFPHARTKLLLQDKTSEIDLTSPKFGSSHMNKHDIENNQ
jgi:hypothetical protein